MYIYIYVCIYIYIYICLFHFFHVRFLTPNVFLTPILPRPPRKETAVAPVTPVPRMEPGRKQLILRGRRRFSSFHETNNLK